MPRKRIHVETTRAQAFTAATAKGYFDKVIRTWEYQQGRDFVNIEAAAVMDINETTFGEIRRGKRQAQLMQCLAIARYLKVPVEEVLRAEGYPDVQALQQWVEADTTPRHPGEQKYVLDMLRVALHAPDWVRTGSDNPFKQQAELMLCSELDTYTKAVYYADAVYNWGHNRDHNIPRAQRQTDEIMALTSRG